MAHIPRLICGCGFEMQIKKTGAVLQGKTRMEDGTLTPYYKISTDQFVCSNCMNSVYVPASTPLTFQHEANYDKTKVDKDFVFAS